MWRKVKPGRRKLKFAPLIASQSGLGWKVGLINSLFSSSIFQRSYLEIGVRKGKTFEKVQAFRRVGIEPAPQFSIRMPPGSVLLAGYSDECLGILADEGIEFDVVFIDGLHEFEQVTRDFFASLHLLKKSGVIVLDDVWPRDSMSATPTLTEHISRTQAGEIKLPGWHGDVWKLVALISSQFASLTVEIVGGIGNAVGVIRFSDDGIGEDFSLPDNQVLARFKRMDIEQFQALYTAEKKDLENDQILVDSVRAVEE